MIIAYTHFLYTTIHIFSTIRSKIFPSNETMILLNTMMCMEHQNMCLQYVKMLILLTEPRMDFDRWNFSNNFEMRDNYWWEYMIKLHRNSRNVLSWYSSQKLNLNICVLWAEIYIRIGLILIYYVMNKKAYEMR